MEFHKLGGSKKDCKSFANTYREGSKNVLNDYCRVPHGALSMLEPCEVKVSRRVLRGVRGGNTSYLPGGPYCAL